MAKSLSATWLRGLKRLTKVQAEQARKLVKTSLRAPPLDLALNLAGLKKRTIKSPLKPALKPTKPTISSKSAKSVYKAAAEPIAEPIAKPGAKPVAKRAAIAGAAVLKTPAIVMSRGTAYRSKRPGATLPTGWPYPAAIAKSVAAAGSGRWRSANDAGVASFDRGAAGAISSARESAEQRASTPFLSRMGRGTWTKSFFSAPPGPGDLVNHLAFGYYEPAGAAVKGRPLVVMLHGCKQDASEFAQGTGMNLLADRHRFAVLYPEQSKHANPHGCWRWYNRSAMAGGGEAASIAALIRHLLNLHKLDPSRVYVAGMSAGAGMATELALTYPQLFAGLGVHSGPAFGGAHSALGGMTVMSHGIPGGNPIAATALLGPAGSYLGIAAMLLHGDDDAVVDPVNLRHLEQQIAFLNGLASPVGWFSGTQVHDTTMGRVALRDATRVGHAPLRVCSIRGLGHDWSGGDATLPYNDASGPGASELLWQFFESKRRDNRPSAHLEGSEPSVRAASH